MVEPKNTSSPFGSTPPFFSSDIISHPKATILELTRDFKTSRRLPEFRRPLDNMSLVTLVKIIALRPLTNFSQSPTFAESDRYFKILKPLAYILSTKNFLTCLNGPQGRNIPPLMSSLRKVTVQNCNEHCGLEWSSFSNSPSPRLQLIHSRFLPVHSLHPPPPLLPRFLLRKHKHHVTTVGIINQITTYFGRLLS